jgi:hypothetical protein
MCCGRREYIQFLSAMPRQRSVTNWQWYCPSTLLAHIITRFSLVKCTKTIYSGLSRTRTGFIISMLHVTLYIYIYYIKQQVSNNDTQNATSAWSATQRQRIPIGQCEIDRLVFLHWCCLLRDRLWEWLGELDHEDIVFLAVARLKLRSILIETLPRRTQSRRELYIHQRTARRRRFLTHGGETNVPRSGP